MFVGPEDLVLSSLQQVRCWTQCRRRGRTTLTGVTSKLSVPFPEGYVPYF